jgi:hypothetical protein
VGSQYLGQHGAVVLQGPGVTLFDTIRFITGHPLNRGHRISSIIHFAKWQIASRLAPGAIVYDWVNGARFLVKTGETGLTGNIYTGLHEFPEMGFVLHFLRDEDLFVDVGANVGSYTILACSAVGARGVAFEPIPSTYGRECSVTVQLTLLDIALHGMSPSLIKIDVEGYESQVLERRSVVTAHYSAKYSKNCTTCGRDSFHPAGVTAFETSTLRIAIVVAVIDIPAVAFLLFDVHLVQYHTG